MFDMHYDLLTVAYVCYLKNDYSYLENWVKAYNKDNIKGVIANLYFMSKKEMMEELHPNYYQKDISVVEMFRKAKEIVEKFLPDTEIIYSIEGCDFLEIEDLDILYNLGLRSILLVWNEKNKYASGNRSNEGLTELGKKLIERAINLGIAIDLSHANEKSFFDIINEIKNARKNKKEVICYASHSNVRNLCNKKRNLTDEEINALRNVDGMIGVFSNRNFVVNGNKKKNITEKEMQEKYVKHIEYITSKIGIDNVAVATDNMDFCKDVDSEYGEVNIYTYHNVKNMLIKNLSSVYNLEEIEKIIYKNAKERYKKLYEQKGKSSES